jgi:hypothetical protein
MFPPSSEQKNSPRRGNGAQTESERGSCGRAGNFGSIFPIWREDSPLLESDDSKVQQVDNGMWSHRWFPGSPEDYEETTSPNVLQQQQPRRHNKSHPSQRSIRRRIFLLLTEPTTSYASAIFFVILIITITASNVIMIMQTMNAYQFTPDGKCSPWSHLFFASALGAILGASLGALVRSRTLFVTTLFSLPLSSKDSHTLCLFS